MFTFYKENSFHIQITSFDPLLHFRTVIQGHLSLIPSLFCLQTLENILPQNVEIGFEQEQTMICLCDI